MNANERLQMVADGEPRISLITMNNEIKKIDMYVPCKKNVSFPWIKISLVPRKCIFLLDLGISYSNANSS